MKKVLIIIALLAGFTSVAQWGERHSQERMSLKDLTPEQRATLSSKRLAMALDLSDAQQRQVKELHLQRTMERNSRMEEGRKTGEASRTMASPDERFERLNARLDQQLAYRASLKKILTEAQYTTWDEMRKHRGKKFHEARRSHRKEGRK